MAQNRRDTYELPGQQIWAQELSNDGPPSYGEQEERHKDVIEAHNITVATYREG